MEQRPASELEAQPLELILARNLVSIISLAAFLVDAEGALVYYNDAAAEVIGARFEERGRLTRDEWEPEIGPLDDHGEPVAYERLPLTSALRDGRPGYGRFFIRSDGGPLEIVASALPLAGPTGNNGALVVFWPVRGDQEA
jgi:PAS domain-containing protein